MKFFARNKYLAMPMILQEKWSDKFLQDLIKILQENYLAYFSCKISSRCFISSFLEQGLQDTL